jgi:DNA polymerase III subunit epsilon
MIRRCLIIDTETTGLDPSTDSVIETGLVLYSVEHQTTLIQFSTLHYASANPAEQINRIPAAALIDIEERYPLLSLSSLLSCLVEDADVIVAHNAEFDRAFFGGNWHSKPWLCTKDDFTWPRQTKPGESLVTLALEHGIGVASAHRALTDCQLIAALFDRMPDLQGMFAHAMRPRATFEAKVSYDEREIAKAAGFRWDGAKKRWTRRMAIEDAERLSFRTVQFEERAAS